VQVLLTVVDGSEAGKGGVMAKMSELDADRQRIERLKDVVAPPTFAKSSAYTPGPWKARGPRFGNWDIADDPADWDGMGRQLIATTPASRKGTAYGDMFRANAMLIAAAPCMLAALRHVMQRCNANGGEIDSEIVAEIEAAIAKAEAA
jgi:hypothetical protein